MSLVKRFFALFPKIKKVRSWLRTRVRGCPLVPADPRRLLSWRSRPCRTPSSGCSSGNASLARLTTGTDVLTVQSGRHQLVSRSCGSAKRMRREGSGTGTGIRVSVRLTSLLFLQGEERYRQPRAVFKCWVPCRLCCVEIFFTVNKGHWFCHPRGTLLVLEVITLVQLTPALLVYVHFRVAWTTLFSLSVSLVVMDGFSDVLTAHGPSCLAATFLVVA